MPFIEIIDQISLSGFRNRANEDRMGSAGGHAWVIDGATGLGEPFMGGSSDAAWLAQNAHEAFTAYSALQDPKDLLAHTAADLVASFDAERSRPLEHRWELPCGAFLLASATLDGVMLSWTGDCRALVRAGEGPIMAFGATPMSEEAETALVEQLSQSGDPAQRYKKPEALAALRAARAEALTKDNAAILSPDLGFLNHLSHAGVAGTTIDMLLMTDGFAAAELRYGLFETPDALFDAARDQGLAAIGGLLRRFEHHTDPDGRLKPRWKRSDDATAIWLRFQA